MNTATQPTELTLTTVNEILELSKKCYNEYHTKRINETIQFYYEVLKFYPCSISVEFTIYENEQGEGLVYSERMNVFLNHDELKIQITFDDYRKKYNIFAHFERMYPNVDRYQRREIEKNKIQPKNIGVLTAKKINEWVKYYEEINEELKTKNDINVNKIELFRAKLRTLNNVQYYKDGKSGYIDNKEKGLTYSFEILEGGYIKEDIRITKSCNLDTFLNLI